jgi:Ribbon-helix-helix protein, copG family
MPRCTEVALVKLTPSELETITRLAALRGLSTSDIVRELLRLQPESAAADVAPMPANERSQNEQPR